MTDWIDLTANDYMDIKYIKQANADLEYLRAVMLSLLDREVVLPPIGVESDIYVIPYPEFINLIERNIDVLISNGYMPSNIEPTRNWLGELKDKERLKYSDVNRWFDSFKKINAMIMGTYQRVMTTGTFRTGEDRTRQLIRTVNG